ncbi:MAG TPA: DUF6174 domain-containing protein [Gemmatimonadaceae bacterium]|nr:DUF6174 domain-containing protein [Gemmatimonadaceae bacterium]
MPLARSSPVRRSLVRVFTPLLLVTLALASSACTVITGIDDDWDLEQRDLDRARRTWSANFIDDYEYVVRRDCFCTLGGVAVRIVVQNHQVISREIDGSFTPVPSSLAYLYPTVDGLFAIIQDALDRRADRVDASYDRAYGFPTDFYIDYNRRIADDEEGYTLIRFRAL